MLFFWTFYFFQKSWKKCFSVSTNILSSTTVFNIDDKKVIKELHIKNVYWAQKSYKLKIKVTITNTKSKSTIAFSPCFLPYRLYAGCKTERSPSAAGWSGHRVQYCAGAPRSCARLPLWRLQCQTLPESAVLCRPVEETRVQVNTLSHTFALCHTVKSFILCLNVRSLTPGVQPIRLRWWMRSQVFCIAPLPPAAPPRVVTVAPVWLTPPRTTSAAVQRASGASGVRSARSNLSVSPRSAQAPS